jgi:hypothetical protein
MELTLREVLNPQTDNVQKKDGYYKYEKVKKLLSHALLFGRQASIFDIDYFCNISAVDELLFNSFVQAEKIQDKDVMYFLIGVQDSLRFVVEQFKVISYLDKNLLEMLVNTKLPNSYVIDRFYLKSTLILMPCDNSTGLIAIMFSATEKGVAYTEYSIQDEYTSPISSRFIHFGCTYDIWGDGKDKRSLRYSNIAFTINFLLWQQSIKQKEREIIMMDTPIKKMGFGKTSKQIITPRMIGADYKPKTIRQESTGTHASPTTHWRSGHWRQQLIGKKENPDHKTIWIEPVLVNG